MEGLKVSVIMLTYNREKLVAKAIESIQEQDFSDYEFIIVDNGSTDRSGKIADQYAQFDERIQVIHRGRGTIGSGRNTGLDAAQGKYITFIDDDDWCEPDFLSFLYDLAEGQEADVSICGAMKEENDSLSPIGVADDIFVMDAEESLVELLKRRRYNTGFPTKFIARRLFQDIRFEEDGRYDDISLMYKVLANANSVVSYGLPKYHVRRHEGNNSLATTQDSLISPEYLSIYRKAYRDRTCWLCDRFPHRQELWWYFDWSFQISMVHKIVSNGLVDCQKHLQEMGLELKEHGEAFLKSPYIMDFEKQWMEDI